MNYRGAKVNITGEVTAKELHTAWLQLQNLKGRGQNYFKGGNCKIVSLPSGDVINLVGRFPKEKERERPEEKKLIVSRAINIICFAYDVEEGGNYTGLNYVCVPVAPDTNPYNSVFSSEEPLKKSLLVNGNELKDVFSKSSLLPITDFEYDDAPVNYTVTCAAGGSVAVDIGLSLPLFYSEPLSGGCTNTVPDDFVNSYGGNYRVLHQKIYGGETTTISDESFPITTPCAVGEEYGIYTCEDPVTFCGLGDSESYPPNVFTIHNIYFTCIHNFSRTFQYVLEGTEWVLHWTDEFFIAVSVIWRGYCESRLPFSYEGISYTTLPDIGIPGSYAETGVVYTSKCHLSVDGMSYEEITIFISGVPLIFKDYLSASISDTLYVKINDEVVYSAATQGIVSIKQCEIYNVDGRAVYIVYLLNGSSPVHIVYRKELDGNLTDLSGQFDTDFRYLRIVTYQYLVKKEI